MTNALVDVRITVDVPEEKLEALIGRPDDGSEAWYAEACQTAEDYVKDDPSGAIALHAISEEVSCG